jgi:hypothetical protein
MLPVQECNGFLELTSKLGGGGVVKAMQEVDIKCPW